jgi:ribonuclease HI
MNQMWKEDKNQLYQKFTFDDFVQAMEFVNKVAKAAETANHHPKIEINWNTVELWLTTHDKGSAVTDKDRQLADQIDKLVQSKETKSSKLPEEIKFYGDGGSRGNPGPAACGFVLMDMEDKILETGGEFMGITTNNQAEYHSLEMGLQLAGELGAKKVHAYMDSMLVVNQLKGIYKVRSMDLMPRFKNIQSLAKQFTEVNYTHVPRALNTIADAEVNRILDSV